MTLACLHYGDASRDAVLKKKKKNQRMEPILRNFRCIDLHEPTVPSPRPEIGPRMDPRLPKIKILAKVGAVSLT